MLLYNKRHYNLSWKHLKLKSYRGFRFKDTSDNLVMVVGVVGSEIGMYKILYTNSKDRLNAGLITAVGNITS